MFYLFFHIKNKCYFTLLTQREMCPKKCPNLFFESTPSLRSLTNIKVKLNMKVFF